MFSLRRDPLLPSAENRTDRPSEALAPVMPVGLPKEDTDVIGDAVTAFLVGQDLGLWRCS
ncbi:MAG: hypothetical protein OXE86_07690 [Alphaproteobacteria bacterium]|nr:hypothetical protein [Alphaproteobacteria bacterium]